MKYRGPGFYEKYMSKNPQSYKSEDKHLLRADMADNGMTRPRDVWLHNLRSILDLDMDTEGKWMTQLPTLVFSADAKMFIVYANFSYMAFYTPTAEHDEFLLTDQCYNVFEGPTHETFCARTGEYFGNTHLCYHEFGPVTPRLIVVLRSMVLPEALEDADPSVQKSRQTMIDAVATQFPDPKKVKSILSDLPVAKATNSYTRVVNGRLELAPGASRTLRRDDKFHFRFWPISTKHVDTINSIFLDNLLRCKSVVFSSCAPFKRTLESYMSMPARGFRKTGIGEHGHKDARLTCLKKLSTVLEMLGSKTVPVWSAEEEESKEPFIQSFDDVWVEMMKKMLGAGDEFDSESAMIPFWQVYYTLALVYTLTKNLDSVLRRKAHRNFLELIHCTHPRRVWLYVKHKRWMFSDEYAMHQQTYVGTAPLYAAKTEALFRAGPEDNVVKGKYFEVHDTSLLMWLSLTENQRLLSALINAAGVF